MFLHVGGVSGKIFAGRAGTVIESEAAGPGAGAGARQGGEGVAGLVETRAAYAR